MPVSPGWKPLAERLTPVFGLPGFGNTRTDGGGVIRPIVLLPSLVNHMAPSGPAVIPRGEAMPGLV